MAGHTFYRRSQKTTDALPLPDAEALDHSQALVRLIESDVAESGGQLPFDRYMERCLYAPGLGYYSAGARKFGEAGDFVTAPETSPVFAQCLARQCCQVFEALGGGDILEFGAGSGKLAADLLETLEALDALPDRYLILEVSPELRERQKLTLAEQVPHLQSRVQWLDGLPETGVCGVVIANEVLDAMPVHRFMIRDRRVFEQQAGQGPEGLVLMWGTPSGHLEASVESLRGLIPDGETGYESEINLRAAPWVEILARCLQAGLILLIDYGYSRAEYYHPQRNRGTLMCHYRHRAHSDPLFYPGLQDITAHVDFTAVAQAGTRSDLHVCGYTTQAYFLLGCGLDQIVARSDPENVRAHMELVQGVKRLTLPSEMGERFKVLGLSRGVSDTPMGFAVMDQRERL
ncbi:MAG: SAM-dependent methyltransferase [Gammaproteobacteria bacterium]|nr:SAM-dependent methyltransferase [Gammaproteobacteria bacterium]